MACSLPSSFVPLSVIYMKFHPCSSSWGDSLSRLRTLVLPLELGLSCCLGASPVAQLVKNLPAKAGDTRDTGSIPGLGRFPGGGNGNPLQYSCRGSPTGQRSLGGYRPRGHKKSDTAGHACTHTAQSCRSHFQSLHEGVTSVDSAWAVTHRGLAVTPLGILFRDKELGFGIRQIRFGISLSFMPRDTGQIL